MNSLASNTPSTLSETSYRASRPQKLPSVIQKTLDVLEEVTHVLQPALGS